MDEPANPQHPYRANVGGAALGEVSEADLKAAQPSTTVKLASLAQGLTGVLVALSGLQVVNLHARSELLEAVPLLLMALGVLQLVLAVQVYRARVWAATASAALGVMLALGMVVWVVFSFWNQIFSCLTLVSVPMAIVSALLAFVAVGSVRSTAAARRRLADQGMSLGF